MVVIRFGITAYTALSVNNYLCAREQAPSVLLFAFSHNIVVLIPATSASLPVLENKRKQLLLNDYVSTMFQRFLREAVFDYKQLNK